MIRTVLLSGLILSLVPVHAFAQDAETIEKVQGHFERGAEAFATRDYETAIREFEAGNGLLPDPIFLYNISLAHGMLGRVEQSLAVARLADVAGLGEPDATQNRARIAGLTRAARAEEITKSLNLSIPVVESSPPFFSWFGWAGVGTAGLGLVGLTASALMDVSIGPSIDNYKEAAAAGDAISYRRLKADIESQQATSRTVFFAGLGLTAIGAALITYDLYFHTKEIETGLKLSLSPDGGMSTIHMKW